MLTHEVFVVPFSFPKKIGASFLDDVYSGCFYGLAKGLLISKGNFGDFKSFKTDPKFLKVSALSSEMGLIKTRLKD